VARTARLGRVFSLTVHSMSASSPPLLVSSSSSLRAFLAFEAFIGSCS